MSERKMVEGLRHEYAGLSAEKFLKEIDKHGGWPVGFEYVGFRHTDAREAGFTNSPHNTEMWTVLASADDYYIWKLSETALQRIVEAVRQEMRIPNVAAKNLSIRGYGTYRLPLSFRDKG